jgi:hypothetical protein
MVCGPYRVVRIPFSFIACHMVRGSHECVCCPRQAYFFGLVVVGTLWISLRVVWGIDTVQAGYVPITRSGLKPDGVTRTDSRCS